MSNIIYHSWRRTPELFNSLLLESATQSHPKNTSNSSVGTEQPLFSPKASAFITFEETFSLLMSYTKSEVFVSVFSVTMLLYQWDVFGFFLSSVVSTYLPIGTFLLEKTHAQISSCRDRNCAHFLDNGDGGGKKKNTQPVKSITLRCSSNNSVVSLWLYRIPYTFLVGIMNPIVKSHRTQQQSILKGYL